MIAVRECSTPADHDAAWRLRSTAFGGPSTPTPGWAEAGWRGWVATEADGRVCGFTRVWPLRQFYGGVAVPMGGVASVAVDPYARGRGVASALLRTALPAMREVGQPISVLYPTLLPLYSGHGWESVGVYETVEVSTLALRAAPIPSSLPSRSTPSRSTPSRSTGPLSLRPVTEADLPAVRACHLAFASTADGLLDGAAPHSGLSHLAGADIATMAVDDASGEVRGYLAASRAAPGLDVHGLVALDPDTRHALIDTLGSWAGSVYDARLVLAEPRSRFHTLFGSALSSEQWMLRVVDLPAAVAARGWPMAARLRPGLTVDLDVVDEHAPWHAGPHRLVCDDGRVTASPGGSGAVRVTARALAAWYAGSASSVALHRAGLLDGDLAAATVLDALTGVPGPPRLTDTF